MTSEPNFPLLFKQIAHYLKMASENPKELQIARNALHEICLMIYGKDPFGKCPTAATLSPRTRTT